MVSFVSEVFCSLPLVIINKKIFLIISLSLCSIILIDEFYNLLFARILKLPRAYDVYSKIGIKYVKFK